MKHTRGPLVYSDNWSACRVFNLGNAPAVSVVFVINGELQFIAVEGGLDYKIKCFQLTISQLIAYFPTMLNSHNC